MAVRKIFIAKVYTLITSKSMGDVIMKTAVIEK